MVLNMQFHLNFLILTIVLAGGTFAIPRNIREAANGSDEPEQNIETIRFGSKDKNAQILSFSNQYNPEDNSFVFHYETDNGIKSEGFAKDNKLFMKGYYVIMMPDGSPVPVRYTADENGFQVDSPAIPTPHPAIARMAAYLRTLSPQREPEEAAKNDGASKDGEIF